jgi:SAM-dependent methyltransferase
LEDTTPKRWPFAAGRAKAKSVTERGTVFTHEQFTAALRVGVDKSYWYQARHRLILRALRRHLPARATLLDVGCGPGFTVDYLRREGFDCLGVELGNPELVPGVASHIKLQTAVEDFPSELAMRVQCLLYLDVIEHVPNPVELLEHGLARCPHAEHVLITVPARPEVWTNYDDHFGHYRRYSRSSLVAEAEQAGLSKLSVGYLFHSLYLAACAIKLLGRDRPVTEEPPTNVRLHSLLARALQAESRLLPTALPGTSVLGVFRRASKQPG